MMDEHGLDRRQIGSALVVVQFGLLALLAALGLPRFLDGRAPAGAWVLAGISVLLGLWALSCNRPGNFNIRPAPRAGGQLVRSGPYRWIRHPMYTAVMLGGGACVWAAPSAWSALALALLVFDLVIKAGFEERWMLLQHPDYAAYRAGTWRFLPPIH
jgi:protein-S-isoprenylcysteine O-methyltransferase Ste14